MMAGVTYDTVLAEAWRGGPRQASLSRFVRLCALEPLTEQQARAVGVLAGTAEHDDTVTSNHTHIDTIAKAARTKLIIERI